MSTCGVSQADATKMASAVITLLPPPSGALQLAPNSGQAGQFLHVAIVGQGTHFVQGVTQAQFGPAYQVGSGIAGNFGPVTVTSPTTAIAQVSVVPNAAPGFSGTVTVQTGTETVSLANGFTTVGTPVLSSLSPVSGQPGQSFTVTIGGGSTNFVQGITQVSFGPGISVGGAALGAAGPVTVTSATTATAQISIDAGAALGPRVPVAQSGSEQAPALAGGFSALGTVTGAAPVASLTSPAESQSVTGPVPVAGTVTSPNMAGWILEYKLADAAAWTQFASGNTAAVTEADPLGHTTTNMYDGNNRLLTRRLDPWRLAKPRCRGVPCERQCSSPHLCDLAGHVRASAFGSLSLFRRGGFLAWLPQGSASAVAPFTFRKSVEFPAAVLYGKVIPGIRTPPDHHEQTSDCSGVKLRNLARVPTQSVQPVLISVPDVAKLIGFGRIKTYELVVSGGIPSGVAAGRIGVPLKDSRRGFHDWLSETDRIVSRKKR